MGNTKQVLVKSYDYYVKEIEIHEVEACPDYIHMLIRLGEIRSELKNIFVINYKKT